MLREKERRRRQRIKRETLLHYSPELKCQNQHCLIPNGCTDIRCLSIDHINGHGRQHRRTLRTSAEVDGGTAFYSWLKTRGYPDGYQVLCTNCQWIKRHEKDEW